MVGGDGWHGDVVGSGRNTATGFSGTGTIG